MPGLLQSKLLRVLQEKQFQRVGGDQVITTDVRVIAATNRNLEEMVARNQFREDLFYRLNGYTISLPPMRERGDDIDLLVDHFRRQANRDLDKNVRPIPAETMDILRKYSWPGNVREVQNVIRQAVLQTTGPVLLPAFLPEYIRVQIGDGAATGPGAPAVDDSLSRLIDCAIACRNGTALRRDHGAGGSAACRAGVEFHRRQQTGGGAVAGNESGDISLDSRPAIAGRRDTGGHGPAQPTRSFSPE